MNIGFVGLGNMGEGVARNLVAAKHSVTVWNRTPARARRLVEEGARLGPSVDAAVRTEVVLSMLADDAAVESVLLDSGVFDRAPERVVHICLSTISVALARRLAAYHRERDQSYVSAPVFGRPNVAAAGELTVVAGGDEAAMAFAAPLFDAFAKKVWRVGAEAEKANVVKLANNFMLAAAIEAMSESAALAGAYGVTAAQLFEITNTTLFDCAAYQAYGKLIASESFEPAGFAVTLGAKDIRLSLAAAEEGDVPLPTASVVRDSLLQAKALGWAAKDWSVLGQVSRERAGQR